MPLAPQELTVSKLRAGTEYPEHSYTVTSCGPPPTRSSWRPSQGGSRIRRNLGVRCSWELSEDLLGQPHCTKWDWAQGHSWTVGGRGGNLVAGASDPLPRAFSFIKEHRVRKQEEASQGVPPRSTTVATVLAWRGTGPRRGDVAGRGFTLSAGRSACSAV